ncbi:hypothetical protein GCM10023191_025460 [Actinoallomurus oryzae]|uniref:Uncharacterized protein n=1 Tax=Actinoallomurus oryzae TaxID=502180 RepID=A0ABP8PTW1_9ACTN
MRNFGIVGVRLRRKVRTTGPTPVVPKKCRTRSGGISLPRRGVIQSMGAVGTSADNTAAEAFNAG